MEEKNIICTACPTGCRLVVRMEGERVVQILGNRCRRGEPYGRQEAISPQRAIASTVRVRNGFHPLLPVYTTGTIPKRRIMDVLGMIREVEVDAPIKANTVILHNVVGTGVDVIASRDMPARH